MARSVALPVLRPVFAKLVLGGRLQECKIIFQNVLDPEEHVAESSLAHQRRQRLAVHGDG